LAAGLAARLAAAFFNNFLTALTALLAADFFAAFRTAGFFFALDFAGLFLLVTGVSVLSKR